jgi:RNA polymerase sigma factor (sigma-70 family)
LQGGSLDIGKGFWQQWEQYRDYLYRCCIKWMGGNPTDAEDALSRAMLKAWEKVQKVAGEIANFKAWLTKLAHNLCVDIHRERSRGANRVENIEVIPEEQGLISFDETPESAMDTGEKKIVIRRAIANLPTRLRETFILHFYQELSYQEIAQQQEISYQNVCKRISQARAILREQLRGYFIGEDGTDTDLSVRPTKAATESAIGEMSKGNAGVEPIVGETVTLFDSAADALPQATEVEEVEIVVSGEPQEAALSVQQRESAMVAAVADGKLKVKRDYCGWEQEAALCEILPATGRLTSPPALLLVGEGGVAPPFPRREGGLGGLGLPKPNSIDPTFPTYLLQEMLDRFAERWSVWVTAGRVLVETYKDIERGYRVSAKLSNFSRLSRDTIDRWLMRRHVTGSVKAAQGYQQGHSHRIKDWDEFRAFAQKHGDKTQSEMAQLWQGQMSKRTMCRALARIGWTRKKRLMATENGMKTNGLRL